MLVVVLLLLVLGRLSIGPALARSKPVQIAARGIVTVRAISWLTARIDKP